MQKKKLLIIFQINDTHENVILFLWKIDSVCFNSDKFAIILFFTISYKSKNEVYECI